MNKVLYAVIIFFLMISIKCSGNRCSPSAVSESPGNIMNYVDGTRYLEDLKLISVDRTLLSPGHQMVQDYCAQRLRDLGYKVELDSYGTGVNVIGRLEGSCKPGGAVMLSAHYDSRNARCPGADDNASGIAGVLEAARVLSKARYNRTLIIALWDEEEKGLVRPRGLHGSRSYAARARLEERDIVLAVVFEMIGYRSTKPGSQRFPAWMKKFFPVEMKKVADNKNRGDFICITVDEAAGKYSDIYTGYADSLALPSLTLKIGKDTINIHDFRRSDHTAFWEQGYSAMMIGDTINYRNTHYHCNNGKVDSVSRLDTAFARDTIKAAVATIVEILQN